MGTTGFLDKAITACETVDDCVRQVVEATVSMGGVALVTADHGNSDQMMDYDTGKPHTAHTTNLVPFIYVAREKPDWRFANGVLGNVAPHRPGFNGAGTLAGNDAKFAHPAIKFVQSKDRYGF